MHLLSSKFPMFLDVASFYSHILTSVFNYIFQVVMQQGIDSTEDQDDYGMDDYDDIFNSPSVEWMLHLGRSPTSNGSLGKYKQLWQPRLLEWA